MTRFYNTGRLSQIVNVVQAIRHPWDPLAMELSLIGRLFSFKLQQLRPIKAPYQNPTPYSYVFFFDAFILGAIQLDPLRTHCHKKKFSETESQTTTKHLSELIYVYK